MSFQADSIAGRIDTGWLLGEHMLASSHSIEHIPRPEAGRGGHDHHIHFRVVEHAAVGIEALIDLGVGQLHLAFVSPLHRPPHRISLGGVEVSRRHQLDVVVDRERIVDRSRPTSTAADNSQP